MDPLIARTGKTIFIVDKHYNTGKKSLQQVRTKLITLGHRVIEELFPHIDEDHQHSIDMIITHPYYNHVTGISDFHEKFPSKPVIFCSMFDKKYLKTIEQYASDIGPDGYYYCVNAEVNSFVEFINYLLK